MKNNNDIRLLIKKRGLAMWQVAEHLGISEWTFTRWLRYDLTPERRAQIIAAIDEMAAENAAEKNSGV